MINNASMLETARPIVAVAPVSLSASATATSLYIDIQNIAKLGIMLCTGAGTGIVSLGLTQAQDASGTGAKALTTYYSFCDINTTAGGGSKADVFVQQAIASGVVTGVALNTIVLLDIDPSTMDINNGFTFLKTAITETGGAAALLVSAFYFGKVLRYSSRTASPDSYV